VGAEWQAFPSTPFTLFQHSAGRSFAVSSTESNLTLRTVGAGWKYQSGYVLRTSEVCITQAAASAHTDGHQNDSHDETCSGHVERSVGGGQNSPVSLRLLHPRLHLPLRPALLQQPRQLPAGGGAHVTTASPGSCCPWRTARHPAPGRVQAFDCHDGAVDAGTLCMKFCKNAIDVH